MLAYAPLQSANAQATFIRVLHPLISRNQSMLAFTKVYLLLRFMFGIACIKVFCIL